VLQNSEQKNNQTVRLRGDAAYTEPLSHSQLTAEANPTGLRDDYLDWVARRPMMARQIGLFEWFR
jgi:hypothetical protein